LLKLELESLENQMQDNFPQFHHPRPTWSKEQECLTFKNLFMIYSTTLRQFKKELIEGPQKKEVLQPFEDFQESRTNCTTNAERCYEI